MKTRFKKLIGETLEKYRKGEISIDKAAEIAGITVSEMMEVVVAHNIKSDETLEEYREGIRILLKS